MSSKQSKVTPLRRTSTPLASRKLASRIPYRATGTGTEAPLGKSAFLERLKGPPGHTPVAKLRTEITTKKPDKEGQKKILLLKQMIEQKDKMIRMRDSEIASLMLRENLLLRYGALA